MTSRRSERGDRPVARSTSATSATSPGPWNWRELRFTPISRPGCPSRSWHSFICRQASRSTQAPISTMSPVSSASGMNSIGGTRPRSGWFQRSSASAPVICPEVSETTGW